MVGRIYTLFVPLEDLLGLVSAGVNSSFENKKMSIGKYKGSEEQNLSMIELPDRRVK